MVCWRESCYSTCLGAYWPSLTSKSLGSRLAPRAAESGRVLSDFPGAPWVKWWWWGAEEILENDDILKKLNILKFRWYQGLMGIHETEKNGTFKKGGYPESPENHDIQRTGHSKISARNHMNAHMWRHVNAHMWRHIHLHIWGHIHSHIRSHVNAHIQHLVKNPYQEHVDTHQNDIKR